MTDQLFDPDLYPSKQDREGRSPQAKAVAPGEPLPEPWVDPWVVVSTRKGPLPYTHLPLEPAKLAMIRRAGGLDRTSLITVCGAIGWPISREASGVGQMLPCPDCKAGS